MGIRAFIRNTLSTVTGIPELWRMTAGVPPPTPEEITKRDVGRALMSRAGGFAAMQAIAADLCERGDRSAYIEDDKSYLHGCRLTLCWQMRKTEELAFSDWESKQVVVSASDHGMCIEHSRSRGMTTAFCHFDFDPSTGMPCVSEGWPRLIACSEDGSASFSFDGDQSIAVPEGATIAWFIREAMKDAGYASDFRHGMKNQDLYIRMSLGLA